MLIVMVCIMCKTKQTSVYYLKSSNRDWLLSISTEEGRKSSVHQGKKKANALACEGHLKSSSEQNNALNEPLGSVWWRG